VNKMTGSSAEFITAAFLGQKNANIIGTNTQGLTSGNQRDQRPAYSSLPQTCEY